MLEFSTDVLKLSSNPSSDQKVMIHRMIDHYFRVGNHGDRLTPEEKKIFDGNGMANTKKQQDQFLNTIVLNVQK